MPRSFLVDSLVLREAGEKKAPEGSPPPLFPYAVPPPHALHGLSPGACHARKAGLLCVCPLCVTASQLHGPPGPPALPLLKASFPPFGGGGGAGAGEGAPQGCKCASLSSAKCSEDDDEVPMSPSSSGKDDRDLTVTP